MKLYQTVYFLWGVGGSAAWCVWGAARDLPCAPLPLAEEDEAARDVAPLPDWHGGHVFGEARSPGARPHQEVCDPSYQ